MPRGDFVACEKKDKQPERRSIDIGLRERSAEEGDSHMIHLYFYRTFFWGWTKPVGGRNRARESDTKRGGGKRRLVFQKRKKIVCILGDS